MEVLGLHVWIWVVLVLYFVGMLALGWWSKHEAKGREGFLMGKRQFGVPMMLMHAFGAGTHPGDVTGVMSGTVRGGPSGIWISWMWMFGTPFYWIIAPVVRRMRCLTMADYFEERFSRAASLLYILIATVGMTIATSSVILATTRTVQGMMAKAESEAWFFGLLFVTTAVFVVYSYWGGIIAAIRTDFVQGLMIIALSFLAIPAAMALPKVGGWSGASEALGELGGSYRSLFDPESFSLATVLALCISAPFSMMAQPHLMTVCGAGRTEWEGRMGFTYGNVLKRICTMGWCVLALCWVAYLYRNAGGAWQAPSKQVADAAFGDAVRVLLPPILQGVMLACVLAAGMSTGSAIQVTVAGLIAQNIYRPYVRPDADEEHYVKFTKVTGVLIITAALLFAIPMRKSVVKMILDYFNLVSAVGIAVGLGILWRRMNTAGVFASAILAAGIFLVTRVGVSWDAAALEKQGAITVSEVPVEAVAALKQQATRIVVERDKETKQVVKHYAVEWQPRGAALHSWMRHEVLEWSGDERGQLKLVCTLFTTTAAPLLVGILAGIVGSLVTRPPNAEVIEKFFKKIYVPIGQEDKLALPLDEAIPPEKRLCTAGGLFLVKPSRQSWVGFLLVVAICFALVGLMVVLIRM
jgi:Na+/proline symporter